MHDLVGIKKLMRTKASQKELEESSTVPLPIKRQRRQRQLLLGLGIPLAALAVYFYGIGRSRYFVSSDVVVRKANEGSPNGLSINTLLGGGNQQSLEDARYLRTYLESPQVLEDLDNSFSFRKAYAKKWPDLYPGLSDGDSREKVYDAFRRQISVSLNESSGELTIRTLAFDSYTALRFNQYLIAQAELFVNRLNQDVYRQQLDFAQRQVELNAKRVQVASQDLQAFQRKNQVLDAKIEAQGSEGFIATLEGELAKQRVQLATLKRQFKDPNAPEIEAIQSEVQELQSQINRERKGLVSPEGKNLNEKAAKQAELEAKLLFATDLYKASLTAAEKTRVDSLQQQRFMAVLSKPLMPEEPWQYWRHKGFFSGVVTLLVGFALTKFLLGMADSHRN
jgi:capsular polysaccharide transport system permease protein